MRVCVHVCVCVDRARVCQVTLLRKHRRQNARTKDRARKMFERTNRKDREKKREKRARQRVCGVRCGRGERKRRRVEQSSDDRWLRTRAISMTMRALDAVVSRTPLANVVLVFRHSLFERPRASSWPSSPSIFFDRWWQTRAAARHSSGNETLSIVETLSSIPIIEILFYVQFFFFFLNESTVQSS